LKKALSLPTVKKKDNHIQNLISEGEHQMLDFKFEISDSRRIARSLAAFANTDGGRLLVGVKDNGAIAGVRSDEEIHMIQAAAEMYCQPKVDYSTEEWEINGKTVLEVIIPKDKHHKHKAPDNQGDYRIFVRVKDENLVADSVLIKVWKAEKFSRPAKIAFTETEELLLHYLSEHDEITLKEFQQMAHINKRKAEAILADFIIVGTIDLIQTSQRTVFRLSQASIFN
jgi:predicted HTH transcriptional regulator